MKQWALPDRVFFAAGACQILAYAFLEAHPELGFQPFWIRPAPGHTGNHIVVVGDGVVFDYHGYSYWNAYWTHTKRRADQQWPGWDADIVPISRPALVSNIAAARYDGLRMKEPSHFLFDPLPRAREYVGKFTPAADVLAAVLANQRERDVSRARFEAAVTPRRSWITSLLGRTSPKMR